MWVLVAWLVTALLVAWGFSRFKRATREEWDDENQEWG